MGKLTGDPPFEEYITKNGERSRSDKGIKDYLIMQTIVSLRRLNSKTKLVVMCNDRRLKSALELQFADDPKVVVYDGFEEYKGIIQLQYEGFQEEFSKKITSSAKVKFWNAKTHTGGYTDFGVWRRIWDEFDDTLNDATRPGGMQSPGYFVPKGKTSVRLTGTSYSDNNGKLYTFTSGCKLAREFESIDQTFRRRVSFAFEIRWKAKISADCRFLGMEFESVALADKRIDETVRIVREQDTEGEDSRSPGEPVSENELAQQSLIHNVFEHLKASNIGRKP